MSWFRPFNLHHWRHGSFGQVTPLEMAAIRQLLGITVKGNANRVSILRRALSRQADVQAVWDSMGKLVEKRQIPHQGIEFPEVHEVTLPAASE